MFSAMNILSAVNLLHPWSWTCVLQCHIQGDLNIHVVRDQLFFDDVIKGGLSWTWFPWRNWLIVFLKNYFEWVAQKQTTQQVLPKCNLFEYTIVIPWAVAKAHQPKRIRFNDFFFVKHVLPVFKGLNLTCLLME